MGLLSILGIGNKVKDVLRKGAVIIDVRTANEFDEGKIKGSINIPTDRLSINLERIRSMRKPVVVCCDTGERSQKAMSMLRANGIKDVYYGGNWKRVLRMIKSL